MREMKESGVTWVGKIPAAWEMKTIKQLMIERVEKNKELEVNTILSLSAKDGVTLYNSENHSGNKPREDLSDYKIVRENDIVVNSMNILSGSVGLSAYTGVVSPVYYIYYPRDDGNVEYFHYIFQCFEFQRSLRGLGNGILIKETESGGLNTIRMRIPSQKLGAQEFPYCSRNEQDRIVAALEASVKKVDALIANQEAQIEKLKAYKQSLITEVVTKGLDPNAPIKDSGVEWIGDIAASHSVWKLKFMLSEPMMYGANESGESKSEQSARYIRITDITADNSLKDDENNLYLANDKAEPYILSDKDILFARSGGTVGKSFMYREEYGRSAFAGYLIKAKCNQQKLIPEYLLYYTQSSLYEIWKNMIFIQATIQNIGANKYSNMEMVVMPISEQKIIVEYLNDKCSKVDELISIKQQKIEKLNQYKKSLIYEYVTGKKEVM